MDTNSQASIDFAGLLGSMLHAMTQPITGKPGGYSEEIFLDLTDEEKENNECNICFLILKDPRECPNSHLFCASCIFHWSMNVGQSNSKCPVCRTEGRYKPSTEVDKVLSQKHVKCPQSECTWAGKLRDYKWHMRSHGSDCSDDSVEFPQLTPRGSNTSMSSRSNSRNEYSSYPGESSRQRLGHLMESFHDRLLHRRENIERHQAERERRRQESLQEVNELGQRLGNVASNISRLLDDMQNDSRRYQRYVSEVQDVLPPAPVDTSQDAIPLYLDPDEARVDRIMAGSTPLRNPFVMPDEFRRTPRGLGEPGVPPSLTAHMRARLPRRRRTVIRSNPTSHGPNNGSRRNREQGNEG